MSEKNEHAENFILFLVVGGLLLAGVLYVLFLFWPYFVYYFLPFILMSLLIGGLFRLITASDGGGEVSKSNYSDSGRYRPHYQYRAILIAYPILIFITLLVFETNSEQKFLVDKKGKEVGQLLEWPKVYAAFNEARSSTYKSSPFDSLKKDAEVEEIYDRRQTGWIVWWALFLGGPAFFMWLSRNDLDEEEKALYKRIQDRVQRLEESLRSKINNQEQIIAREVEPFQLEAKKHQQRLAEVLSENQRLQATVEFSREVPKPVKSSGGSQGLLDGDIL